MQQWIDECVALCKPDKIYVCNGRRATEQLIDEGVRQGVFIPAQSTKASRLLSASEQSQRRRAHRAMHVHLHAQPGTWPARPTIGWSRRRPIRKLSGLFDGCMKGRTMYVIPFVMGPIGSPLAKVGIQLTDSIYVAVNMGIMTRMGQRRLEAAWRQRRIHALPPQRRRLQSGPPIYLPFPAGQHHLELRQRLRRQCAAGQEMPGPAHRQLSRPAAGMDGRAHAD